MSVIPKSEREFRLIHDCSFPPGQAVYDYVSELEHFRYQTIDDATAIMQKGCFMSKCDPKSAYRSVPISSSSQKVAGLKWFLRTMNGSIFVTPNYL